jgi:hypothetical protein
MQLNTALSVYIRCKWEQRGEAVPRDGSGLFPRFLWVFCWGLWVFVGYFLLFTIFSGFFRVFQVFVGYFRFLWVFIGFYTFCFGFYRVFFG